MVQETYKTTWLANAPEHWDTLRIKNIFAEIDERSETGEEELLSVSHYTGITKKRDSLENETDFISNAKTLVGYKKVAKSDLVSNIMLAWNGSLGISKFDGITSPAYCVYRIKGDNNPDYYGYLFSTAFMKAEFRKKSFGIIDSRLRLYSDKFFSIPVPVPPKTEQDHIVGYIKAQSKKIKHFIKKKQAFMALLKEQKTSLVYKYITKGTNVSVKLKQTGNQFASEIGEGFAIEKFNNFVFIRHGFQFRDYDFKPEGIKIVKISQLSPKGYLDLSSADTIDAYRKDDFKNIVIQDGDILMALTGGTIGKIIVADTKGELLLQNYRVGKFSLLREGSMTYEYLYHQLSSDFIQSQINFFVRETGQPNIGKSDFRNMSIIIPPKIEQDKIVTKIKTETAKIDQAIAKAQKEIELIKEYKEAMIAEAVLGKFNHNIVKS